jgi:hypothetical protein
VCRASANLRCAGDAAKRALRCGAHFDDDAKYTDGPKSG